jgi:outer membrane autotransporter protein
VLVGSGRPDGTGEKVTATVSGLGAGVDTRLMDGLKAGAAVSLAADRAKFGGGGQNDGQAITGTVYGSWRAFDTVFVDAMLGYGDLRNRTRRWDTLTGSLLTGERPGALAFGSVAVSWDQTVGELRWAPFARWDLLTGRLARFSEQGNTDAALAYRELNLTGSSTVLGLRAQYSFVTGWGTIGPSARVEWRHALARTAGQGISYADDPSELYVLPGSRTGQNSFTGALGLNATTGDGITGSLELIMSRGDRDMREYGVRGSARIPF